VVGPPAPFPVRLFFSLLGTLRAVPMASFSRLPAILASPDISLLTRLLLRTALSFVAGFFLASPFPLSGAGATGLGPRQTFLATGAAGNLLLRYGLAYPCQPSEAERIPKVEIIVGIFVPVLLVFADLPSQGFGQRLPAHEGRLCASFHVACSVHNLIP